MPAAAEAVARALVGWAVGHAGIRIGGGSGLTERAFKVYADAGRQRRAREDQVLPHLAAVAILLSGDSQSSGAMQVTAPSEAADLIDQVHAAGITLTYDPDTRTLRTGDISIAAIAVGQAH